MNLGYFFCLRNIAVHGGKWSDFVLEQCSKLGFPGEVCRVHLKRNDCFSPTEELSNILDSAFTSVNIDITLNELRYKGLGETVMFVSGFRKIYDEKTCLEALAATVDFPYIGLNYYGFINSFERVALWPDQVVRRSHEC